jgi:hypothetical protein
MAKGVIAKKQVFGLLMVLVLVLFFVFVTTPIVQATGGGTGVEPIPNTPVNPSSSGIDDPLIELLFTIMSLLPLL